MAISHRVTSTALFGFNSMSPTIGAGSVAGDMMVLMCGGKPYNSSVSVSGWTQLSTFTNGTTAAGVDTGSMFVTAWWKIHTGSESNPTITEGATTWDVVGGIVMTFQKAGSDAWATPTMTGGGDANASDANFVVSSSPTNMPLLAGDVFLTWGAFRSDAATPCATHITGNIGGGGSFTNTHDPATDPESASGGDMGMCVNRAEVLSNSANDVANASAVLAAAHSGTAGFIKLHVDPASNPPRSRQIPQLLAH